MPFQTFMWINHIHKHSINLIMIRWICIFILFCFPFWISCGTDSSAEIPPERDTLINSKNAYSVLFFDSSSLEKFINERNLSDSFAVWMRDFYNVRNYQSAWFDTSGMNEQTLSFWNLQRNYIAYSKDSALFNPGLQKLMDSVEQYNETGFLPGDSLLNFELGLTYQFFRYAVRAYRGNRDLNPEDLKWFIPRKRTGIISMLDSISSGKSKDITDYEPVNRQYGLLRSFLQKYSEIHEQGGWKMIPLDKGKFVPGDSAPAIILIKFRLQLTGDYTEKDTTPIYNDSLLVAVKNFQERVGLQPDGVIGAGTIREMNIPLNERVKQILINLERLKWIPAEPKSDYLLINIPEYKLHIYENGRYTHNMRVVVGSTQHNTVIFTGALKYVVFSPYWNVPPGILKNEVLPGIQRDPSYLARHRMEWHNGYVRQKPGPANSLGLVKFLFPNNYNIYLHDTPSKNLFQAGDRAFSHGCIRVAEPKMLAQWLLRNEPKWNEDSITKAMNAGKERYVTLATEVPVFIGYFTAWVDRQGRINFRKDVYGHDKILGQKLFSR